MLKRLIPQMYISSVLKIDPQKLVNKGIRGMIIDIDNTIVPWASFDLSLAVAQWLERVKASGIVICVVSNAKSQRVTRLITPLGIPAIPKAGKPMARSFRKAMKILQTTPRQTAVVGDQLFTDILGGNRLKLYTILVAPMSKKEFFGTRLMRQLERPFLRKIKRK